MNGLEQEDNGEGVEKDEGKAIYHLEEAAMGGHPRARYDLGLGEATIAILAVIQKRDTILELTSGPTTAMTEQ